MERINALKTQLNSVYGMGRFEEQQKELKIDLKKRLELTRRLVSLERQLENCRYANLDLIKEYDDVEKELSELDAKYGN